jgi:hypothetical protein
LLRLDHPSKLSGRLGIDIATLVPRGTAAIPSPRQKETVVFKILCPGLLALVFAGAPAQARIIADRDATAVAPAARSRTVQIAQYDCRMFGPYATMRRANEVANEARSYGFSAVAFHNGDGYYVRVC